MEIDAHGHHAPASLLPPELIRPILEHIEDWQTLRSLSLSCSLLRSEAEVILYRSFTEQNADRQIQFLAALVGNPRLAALVQIYAVRNNAIQREKVLLDLIRDALPIMVNLKDLALFIKGQDAGAIPFQECTFQLDTMCWVEQDGHVDEYPFINWLEMQHSLRELKWLRKMRRGLLSPLACPNLKILRGNQSAIYGVLPGRNITRLHWMSIMGLGLDSPLKIEEISSELNQLRSLSIQNYFELADYKLVINNLHSLEFLELFEYPDTQTIASFHPLLPPNIKSLVFSFRPTGSHQTTYYFTQKHISAFFACCQHLRRVDVASKRIKGEDYYQRWTTEDGAPWPDQRLIPFKEVAWGRLEFMSSEEGMRTSMSGLQHENELEDWS
ncbi:hypothetical protein BDZ97DRAFT_356749 [Flammula alnicola]|nr:hypothetical protein BDZ97DRAFT_356749 [Flammula alnicola]